MRSWHDGGHIGEATFLQARGREPQGEHEDLRLHDALMERDVVQVAAGGEVCVESLRDYQLHVREQLRVDLCWRGDAAGVLHGARRMEDYGFPGGDGVHA